MKDIYDATVLCDACGGKTQKSPVVKNNFDIRTWHCLRCQKQWYHPLDMRAYNEYMNLKKKEFEVKLRSVGNSYIVSIPKEIVRFQEISATKVVHVSLEDPGKVILTFHRVRKVY